MKTLLLCCFALLVGLPHAVHADSHVAGGKQVATTVSSIIIYTPDMKSLARFYEQALQLPAPSTELDNHIGYWLGDNYVFKTGNTQVDGALKPAFTFQSGDKTVGVFSLTLNPVDGGNERSYLENDGDYMGVAEKTIQVLEAKGVDLIIGVTHLHMWQDVELAGLKAAYPKLAFIVGGHEHEPEHSPGSDTSAVVMKGASNTRVVWVIDVDFDDAGRINLPAMSERRFEVFELQWLF